MLIKMLIETARRNARWLRRLVRLLPDNESDWLWLIFWVLVLVWTILFVMNLWQDARPYATPHIVTEQKSLTLKPPQS